MNTDWNATLPEGVSAVDVAALLKLYLSMLPEPLLTVELYDDVVDARGSDRLLRQYLCTLPAANYSTLECLTALLLRISQKSALNKVGPIHICDLLSMACTLRLAYSFHQNRQLFPHDLVRVKFHAPCNMMPPNKVLFMVTQMDAHSLAIELSPFLLWRRSKVAPSELQTGHEAKPTAGARSLRRFSSVKAFRKGGDDTGAKGSALKPSSVSVRVDAQGDSNKEWSTLQGIIFRSPYHTNQVRLLQESLPSITC